MLTQLFYDESSIHLEEYYQYEDEVLDIVKDVLRSGKLILGPNVANFEKELPKSFITRDGFGITSMCKSYIKDLISGEDFPPYKNGVPVYAKLKLPLVKKKLKKFKVNL